MEKPRRAAPQGAECPGVKAITVHQTLKVTLDALANLNGNRMISREITKQPGDKTSICSSRRTDTDPGQPLPHEIPSTYIACALSVRHVEINNNLCRESYKEISPLLLWYWQQARSTSREKTCSVRRLSSSHDKSLKITQYACIHHNVQSAHRSNSAVYYEPTLALVAPSREHTPEHPIQNIR